MKRAAALLLAFAACKTAQTGELEPRYIAVHNTLSAMGLAEIGPIQKGSLAEGRDARFAVDLPADCATIVAIGGADVRDLDLEVRDADDKEVGRDATTDSEAAVKVCPPHAGKYSLVVKMTKGAGTFVVASWSGAPNAVPAASNAVAVQTGAGTCDSPMILGAGLTNGNTRRGLAEQAGKCGSPDSKEIVYKLELEKRQRVLFDLDPTFDSILYVRKDDCGEKEAEVACNDDAPISGKATHASRIEEVLDAGTYYVFVDGYQQEVGAYKLNVELADVPSIAEECKSLQPLASHAQGSLTGTFDALKGLCGGDGPEAPYRLDLPSKARARVKAHSDEFTPVAHLRKVCTDDASELSCSMTGMKSTDAVVVAALEQGSYTVFADSTEKGMRGRYSLDVDLTTPDGKGVRGDACGDAIPIVPEDKLIDGDTFDAKDDFAPSCASAGAPDTMYRFDIAARSRVTVGMEAEEGGHAFALFRNCNDRASEIACGSKIDELLAPGVYWLAVDGTDRGPFGRYQLKLRAKDMSLQDAACRGALPLTLGQKVASTTAGATDKFTASCAGSRVELQASGDRVFRLSLNARTHVQLLLVTPTHDGVLALRKTCLDPPAMKTPREAEISCNNDTGDTRHSMIDATLDAGTYYVLVDGHQGKHEGAFTLEAKTLPK